MRMKISRSKNLRNNLNLKNNNSRMTRKMRMEKNLPRMINTSPVNQKDIKWV